MYFYSKSFYQVLNEAKISRDKCEYLNYIKMLTTDDQFILPFFGCLLISFQVQNPGHSAMTRFHTRYRSHTHNTHRPYASISSRSVHFVFLYTGRRVLLVVLVATVVAVFGVAVEVPFLTPLQTSSLHQYTGSQFKTFFLLLIQAR